MASRSTRNKIRYQAEKAINHVDIATENLAKMDAMANERSPFINDNLPPIIAMLELLKKTIEQLRERM